MLSTTRLLPVALLVSLLGCAVAEEADETTGHSLSAVGMTASQAQLVLELVNYPGTDLALLDDEVGLDRRAAENITAYRNGTDQSCPSGDDELFNDLAELDAVAYVGESAFAKLLDWATAHPAPAAEQVEGVTFAGWQAAAIVWGVNGADVPELDVVVGLDARAAQNLVAAAPYGSVSEMGPVGYVGQSALDQLLAYAPAWWAELSGQASSGLGGTFDGVTFDETTAGIALEIANVATIEQLTDHGMWSQGANAIVQSRPYVDLAQVAGVSGVGAATMQALHAYASSPEWPADCSTELAFRNDADVADFDGLLAAATMGDWPYGAVIALQVNPCIDMGMSNERDSVIEHIIADGVIDWVAGPNPWQYMDGDDFEHGASLFVSRMDVAKAEECSEDATIILDPATNHIWIMHRMPGC
ncbi:MAG: hypothetical protein JRI68_02840 [Deltaproteobacteria bacterium]|nr:hypothetical protein [Deltaproteobacteria bacterium]